MLWFLWVFLQSGIFFPHFSKVVAAAKHFKTCFSSFFLSFPPFILNSFFVHQFGCFWDSNFRQLKSFVCVHLGVSVCVRERMRVREKAKTLHCAHNLSRNPLTLRLTHSLSLSLTLALALALTCTHSHVRLFSHTRFCLSISLHTLFLSHSWFVGSLLGLNFDPKETSHCAQINHTENFPRFQV